MEHTINRSQIIKTNTRGTNLRAELRLVKGQPVSIYGDQRGRTIRSVAGAVWVSQDGDPIDHILNPGERFLVTRRGQVVVESFGDSRAVLQ
jgi:hypothetical protein